jgi:hypothetical protein
MIFFALKNFENKEGVIMPGFDGKGPAGAGPMTGGGRGYCNPANAADRPRFSARYGYGRGFGMRRGFRPAMRWGRGLGRGCGWYPPAEAPAYSTRPETMLETLKAEAEAVKASLDAIHKRIEELEKKATE